MNKTVIIFVLTYLGGLASTVLVDVSYGVYLYELHYFLNPVARWWYGSLPDLRYSFIIAVFMIVGYFLHNSAYQENRISDLPQTKWILALLIMMAAINLYALWPEYHLNYFIQLSKLLLFITVAYKCIDTPTKFERMIWIFLVGSFYVGWIGHETGRTEYWRMEGIGMSDSVNSNGAAAVLITSIPIFIFYLIKGRLWQKFVSLAGMAFVFDSIILISSRGSFLGLFVAGLYFGVIILKEKFLDRSIKLKIMAIGLVGVGLFLFLADDAFWERMGTIVKTVTGEETREMSRVYYWKKSLEVAKRYPFGAGAGGYNYLSPQLLPEKYLTENGTRSVHSTYFQALSEFGYLGPILLIGFIFSNFKMVWQAKKIVREKENNYLYLQIHSISASFVAFLVAAAFLDRLYAEMLYWFPLFIASFVNIYQFKEYAEREDLSFELMPKRLDKYKQSKRGEFNADQEATSKETT